MWRSQAEAEGLTLLEADNKTGYYGVHLTYPDTLKPYQARVNRCGTTVSLGSFATADGGGGGGGGGGRAGGGGGGGDGAGGGGGTTQAAEERVKICAPGRPGAQRSDGWERPSEAVAAREAIALRWRRGGDAGGTESNCVSQIR